MKKSLLCMILAIVMIFGMVPVTAADNDYSYVTVELYANELYKNSPFSFDGIIKVYREDGTFREFDFWDCKQHVTFSGYDMTKKGEYTVKVQLSSTYNDLDTTYTLKVVDEPNKKDSWAGLQEEINKQDPKKGTADEPLVIKLEKDVIAKSNDSALVIPEGKYVTIDLNGHVLNRNLLAFDPEGGYSVPSCPVTGCAIINNGVLKIVDSKPNDAHAGTLLPSGGVITGGNATKGAGIYNTGTLTLEAGNVYRCYAHGYEGTEDYTEYGNGGAIMNEGIFTMTGGKISNCTSQYGGGAVYNEYYTSEFTMSGGAIENCTATTNGGGVYNEGTFTMLAGEIKNCTALQNGGAVNNDGTFVMSAGCISNCTALETKVITALGTPDYKVANGGGVFNTGSFEMNGTSIIQNCQAQRGSGVWNSNSFTMAGGLIQDCYVAEHKDIWEWGGGVYNESSNGTAQFAMSSGVIQKCKAAYGAGICSYTNADVNVLGDAEVKYNNAYDAGAGVYNHTGSTLTMAGSASITNCTSAGMGAGIENLGVLNLNQSAKVLNNKQNDKDSNIYLDNGTKIHFGAEENAPTSSMKVSVTATSKMVSDNGLEEYGAYLAADEGKKAIVFVTDHFEIVALSNITVGSLTNGLVIADKSTANAGDTVTLTVAPYNGYQLKADSLKANDGGVTLNKVDNATYVFTMPSIDVDVTAEFEVVQPTTVYYYGGGGGGTTTVTYVITVNGSANGKLKVDNESGKDVVITVEPNTGCTLETLTVVDKKGKEITVKNLGDNKYSFTMPSSNVEITPTFMEDNTMLNFCVDVKANDFFYDSVLWAYDNSICQGVEAMYFCPERPVTRAEVITFMWRAAGCPVVNYWMNLSDVDADSFYAEAVRWALSEKITNGTSYITFSPYDVCSRAQIVTLLSRYAGAENVEATDAFTDVSASDYFAAAVAWAKENNITAGTTAITFSPDADCTRSQAVTFLYRMMEK